MIYYMGRMSLEDRIKILERVIETTSMFGSDEGMEQIVEWLKELKTYKEWLSSFNTDSATECFTAVQELKKIIFEGGGEMTIVGMSVEGMALKELKYVDEEDDWMMGYNKAIDDAIATVNEWLSSFNTDSATKCFIAVQELKKLYSEEVKEDECKML